MPIATMAAVQQVPQVSFSATSFALSNKDSYPYFLRTAPPDNIQALAIWRWILQFQVVLATCLYTTESYGQGLYTFLTELAQADDEKHRVQGQGLKDLFEEQEARRVVRIARRMGSRFIILMLTQSMAAGVIPILGEEGMLSANWQILGADTMASSRITGLLPVGFMFFLSDGRGERFPDFKRLWDMLEPEDILGAESQATYRLDKMREPLANGSVERVLSDLSDLSAYAAFAFDAVYTFIIAINRLLHAGVAADAIRGQVLLQEMRRTSFTGVSGEVSFDENGDRLCAYQLWNMKATQTPQGQSAVEAAVAASFSASTLNFSFIDGLVWMDGSQASQPPPELYSCDPGFYKDISSTQCMECPRGQICLGGPQAPSLACPRGTFANSTGLTACLPCPRGTAARDVGSVECTPCQPGFEAPREGMEACTRCEPGSYMPSEKGARCMPCGQNQITLYSGAVEEDECLCPEGSFMCQSRGCTPCVEGLDCPVGSEIPQQRGGFWTEFSGAGQCDFVVLRCRDQKECPAGPLGLCAPGREGLACNNCKEKYFPTEGGCEPCGEVDILPTLLFLMVVLVGLFLLSISSLEPNQVSLNTLTAFAVTSQLVMAVQSLSSIRELALEWQEPVKTLVDLSRVFAFDLHIIRITCFYGTDTPALHFISQMLACPAACGVLLCSWVVSKLCGRPKPMDTILNHCGLLFFAFFLSITLTIIMPFQCVPNPDGRLSMSNDPGIVCYESDEHSVLVALAVIGFLSQPAAVLAWATFAIIMYPRRVATGRGLRMVNKHRFLFHRFKPANYYFGLVLLYRNGLVALLPVILVGVPSLQVPLMGAVLLASTAIQAHLCPWRTARANLVDFLLTSFLLVTLLGAAPLLQTSDKDALVVLSWLLCIPVLGILVVALSALARTAMMHFQKRLLFGIFLCHHKGGAGSLCRLMKILIARHTSTRVFLDCDQLENLDFLFDIIRTSTKSVVVVLTPELLRRVWCGGEITTAWMNKITTVPLICDGFRPLSDEAQKMIPSLWTPQQKQILANYGVEIDAVHAAYDWLQHELIPLEMPRFGPVTSRETAVVDMLRLCGLAPALRSTQLTQLNILSSSSSQAFPSIPARARILVTSSVTDAECLSACEVFTLVLMAHLHVECAVVHNARHMSNWKPFAYYLVVLLFRGIFRDQTFAKILLSADSPSQSGRSLELVSVIADTHFDFPSIESLEMATEEEYVGGVLSDPATTLPRNLFSVYRDLLNVLALPFSPLASEGLQQRQVAEIAGRLHRYKDAAAAASKDEADDGMIENEMHELSSHNASMDLQDFRGFVPQAFSLLSDDGFDLRSETFSM
ncbi:GRM1 [Symbiodinium sp. CCMP2456]|nr:GRM1 [Symbiodinium sp. CCMP2456]